MNHELNLTDFTFNSYIFISNRKQTAYTYTTLPSPFPFTYTSLPFYPALPIFQVDEK